MSEKRPQSGVTAVCVSMKEIMTQLIVSSALNSRAMTGTVGV